MALLSQGDKDKIFRAIQREWSRLQESCNFVKADLSAAVTNVDQWIEDNAASFNNALPANFKNGATAAQKALLLNYVVTKRTGRSNPDEN